MRTWSSNRSGRGGIWGVVVGFLEWRGLVRVRGEHDESDVLGAIDEESRHAGCQSFLKQVKRANGSSKDLLIRDGQSPNEN